MFYNLSQMVEHNQKFLDSFVDLKVQGWKAYSKALDSYTNSFYTKEMKQLDQAVDTLADTMKKSYRMPQGVCK